MKKFKMEHKFFSSVLEFDEFDAPDWLTSDYTVVGSTMDYRWFWEDHVLMLGVGECIETDFNWITRLE
jgi:hypothetical protein